MHDFNVYKNGLQNKYQEANLNITEYKLNLLSLLDIINIWRNLQIHNYKINQEENYIVCIKER